MSSLSQEILQLVNSQWGTLYIEYLTWKIRKNSVASLINNLKLILHIVLFKENSTLKHMCFPQLYITYNVYYVQRKCKRHLIIQFKRSENIIVLKILNS